MILPFFKSHYSINKSILTLKEDHDGDFGPRSIVKLAEENDLKNFFVVDDNLSGFLEGYTNSKEKKSQFNFGVRMIVCEDMDVKNNESLNTEHKVIVFLKKSSGYDKLFSLYSEAATRGFYYLPRIDLKTLRKFWNDEHFTLAFPYYDSFIFNNCFSMKTINFEIKDLPTASPLFVFEKNGLFFEKEYSKFLLNYVKSIGRQSGIIRAKSIYYNKNSDFLAYLTMRCIGKKSQLQKPNLDFMSSDKFSLESYLEGVK